MKYNNNMYYYVKNLQGDIVKILDSNGGTVAGYYYDAWGTITGKTVTNTTIDTLSPFRYRGYVYDIDTGFYYLQSRYYDPQTGRFINADDTKHINDSSNIFGENLFAYCYNQYIKNIDKTGKKATISAGVSSKYYRRRAVEYAKKWWLMRNSQFYSYFEDCTNFVSQCLFEGGIPMMFTEWYSFRIENGIEWSDYTWYISNTWRLCNDNYKYFKNSRYAQKTITIKDKRKSVVSAVKKLKKGDPMYFDDNGDGIPNHAVIITKINTKKKKIKYTAHSFSNIDKDLEKYLTHESGSKKKVYAIHIKNNF